MRVTDIDSLATISATKPLTHITHMSEHVDYCHGDRCLFLWQPLSVAMVSVYHMITHD